MKSVAALRCKGVVIISMKALDALVWPVVSLGGNV